MVRLESLRICLTAFLTALAVAGCGALASAVSIDFENPPYGTGSPLGQDGWAQPGYYATPNGMVTVSTASPLSGAQSLSYVRTELGLAFTFSDVHKADVVTIAKDGTAAPDLTTTFLISARSLSAQGLGFGDIRFYLSPNGAGTPIAIRLNNAGHSSASIEELSPAGWNYFGGSAAAAGFLENNTLEFVVDVDFDSSTYQVSRRDVTAGGPMTSPGIARNFASSFVANPNGTYDVDVIAGFIYGAGKIDDIRFTGNIVPEPATLGLGVASVMAFGLYRRRFVQRP